VCENKLIYRLPGLTLRSLIAALLLLGFVHLLAAQTTDDWQSQVRQGVENQHIDAALAIVDQRLADAPEDWEAHGWRGRLLAWKGRWSEGEAEYKLVLDQVPNDTEILTGLSDVLLWQKKYAEALQTLDQARKISPSDPEILSRRARVLALLGRTPEARSEYQQTLLFDTQNADARTGLDRLREDTKHELRVGEDVDIFNYANSGQTQGVSLSRRQHLSKVWPGCRQVSGQHRLPLHLAGLVHRR
jgi:Flp pilus assembly protein TadD